MQPLLTHKNLKNQTTRYFDGAEYLSYEIAFVKKIKNSYKVLAAIK